ncbi:MAG: hypothetical protein JWP75_1931 [Frondihabitans sp.]|nr:hypothetical protein [Frondihabitans sp.]
MTQVGARAYDPTIGKFLSVDAVLAPANPLQNNGYAYGANSPLLNMDPSGNCIVDNNEALSHVSNCPGGQGTNKAGAGKGNTPPPVAAGNSTGGSSNMGANWNCKFCSTGFDSYHGKGSGFAGRVAAGVPLPIGLALGAVGLGIGVAACIAATLGVCAPFGVAAEVGVASATIAAGSAEIAEQDAEEGVEGGTAASEGAGDDADTLYRSDDKNPGDALKDGFKPKGSNMNLLGHAANNPSDSGFVSTSKSFLAAQEHAEDQGYDFIYKLHASGLDVNAELGESSPYPFEDEIAVPGPIPGSQIEGYWGPTGWVSNPGYGG